MKKIDYSKILNLLTYGLVCFFVILIYSCGGVSDSQVDLGSGFQLALEGKDDVFISGPVQFPANIDSVYFDEKYIMIHQIPNYSSYVDFLSTKILVSYGNDIEGKTDKYHFNMDSVISELRRMGMRGDNREYDRKMLAEISDSILKANPYYNLIFSRKHNYWLIVKKNFQVYGPLTNEEFYSESAKLAVQPVLEPTR